MDPVVIAAEGVEKFKQDNFEIVSYFQSCDKYGNRGDSKILFDTE